MRKVVSSLFITLDGVVEEPGDWQEHFDDEMMAALQARLASADSIILGRATYDYWYEYWPTATMEPFASFINHHPKYVVSSTLESVEWGAWNNIELLKGDLIEEIKKLKAQTGKDISIEASPSLVKSLMDAGLLDELQLMIHPVFMGKGKHFFEEGDLTRLKLLESKTSSTGSLIVTYQPLPRTESASAQ
jgi:dihydrofolate reductase